MSENKQTLKAIIIGLSTAIFLFLLTRLLIGIYSDGEAERKWYVEKLGFQFSGKVDTVIMKTKYQGFVIFHLTEGNIDKTREDRLNEQLTHNTYLRFLVFKPMDQLQFRSKVAYKSLPGDSVRIDTDKDQVLFYRNGKRISAYPVTESLNERFFQ
jgi:hypothetical protein